MAIAGVLCFWVWCSGAFIEESKNHLKTQHRFQKRRTSCLFWCVTFSGLQQSLLFRLFHAGVALGLLSFFTAPGLSPLRILMLFLFLCFSPALKPTKPVLKGAKAPANWKKQAQPYVPKPAPKEIIKFKVSTSLPKPALNRGSR